MKRFVAAALGTLCLAGQAGATSKAYDQALASNQVVSSTVNYTIDASSNVIDLLSMQVTLSTASPAAATFKDGHISSGTITVTSATFLSSQAGQDTIAVTTNSALSPTAGSDSILVSSGVTGSSITVTTNKVYILRDNNQYTHVATTTGTAMAIASAVNTYVANVTATVSGSSVIITCNANGSFCNSYALASSTAAALTVASANFTGGNDNASFNLNGHTLYQGSDWFQKGTSSDTAVSILNAITPIAAFTASTNTSTSVLIQCASSGSFCNADTLTASTGALTIGGASFTGGQDNAILVINGTKLVQGTDFTAGSSSATAANAIAAAINANSSLSAIIVATAPLACSAGPCGVVYATGTITTGSNNYVWQASSGVTLSSSTLLAGAASAYKLNSGLIALPSHGMATNMQVLYSTKSATALGGLSNQTTYYVIAVDANDIELALTSTGSLAGTFITLTSTPAVGGDSFSLAPLAMTATAVVQWQASNDNVNWGNLSLSAATIAPNGAASSTVYDLGATNLKFYRANVIGPATGGVNVTIRAYGKRYGSGL